MKSIFSYDSKLTQTVMTVADYIILNVLFVICCIPIITIGAAQAGLYSGISALNNPDDDTSCIRKFFQGFRSGFGTITLLWTITLAIIGLLSYLLYVLLILKAAGAYAPVWVCAVALVVLIIYQSVMVIFHSRFGCTPWRLVKNTLFVIFAHPLRSIAVALLIWFPVLLCALAFNIFIQNLILLAICYYSIASQLSLSVMKKPFKTLEDNFYSSLEEAVENEEEITA